MRIIAMAAILLCAAWANAKNCTVGKPCGDTCIEQSDTCHVDGIGGGGLVVLGLVAVGTIVGILIYSAGSRGPGTPEPATTDGTNVGISVTDEGGAVLLSVPW